MRSVKLGLLAAGLLAATALTSPAFADSTHICQGNADCSVGGGNGGNGGNVGDVTNINANINVTKNDNYNKNYNDNYNKNYNDNYNKNYNTNKQYQDQDQHQKQGQLQGQAQSVDNVGNVNIENKRPPVNTAYSAALAVSEDTCMGSSSIGGQAVSFGLTIGTTWTDDNC